MTLRNDDLREKSRRFRVPRHGLSSTEGQSEHRGREVRRRRTLIGRGNGVDDGFSSCGVAQRHTETGDVRERDTHQVSNPKNRGDKPRVLRATRFHRHRLDAAAVEGKVDDETRLVRGLLHEAAAAEWRWRALDRVLR